MSTRGPQIAPRTSLAPSPSAMSNIALSALSPESASPGSNIAPAPSLVTSIVTSREWVLPPRPKPGRKPSVDTPALKRKAQNRAAQRAFRERRATRVQELEQKLLEVEKEKEVKEMGLVNTINKLKFENQFLLKSIEQLKLDFHSLRSAVGLPSSPNHASSNTPSPRNYGQSQNQPPNQYQMSQGSSAQRGQQNPHQRNSRSSASSQGLLTMLHANPNAQQKQQAYSLDVNQSAQHLLNFAKSLPANHSTGSPALLQYSVQQILPAPSADSPPTALLFRHVPSSKSTLISPTSQNATPIKDGKTQHNNGSNDDLDCGVCLKEQCLCEDIGIKQKPVEEQFNSFTPQAAVLLKSKKRSRGSLLSNSSTGQEIDFTAEFSVKKMPDLKRLKKSPPKEKVTVKKENDNFMSNPSFNEESPVENCGFCSDDTPCVCREAAKEAARINESLTQRAEEPETNEDASTSLPPLLNSSAMRKASLPVMHPGPTLEIREFTNLTPGAVPTVVSRDEEEEPESKAGCTGNPGTCAQCQTDPMSTLFCTTVASRASKEPSNEPEAQTRPTLTRLGPEKKLPIEASPGKNEPEEVEVMKVSDSQTSSDSRPNSFAPATTPSTPLPTTPGGSTTGIFIPCADAYKTLSRHKKFNSVDFTSLVGKLTTRGMQVEVQSVANVLRELDRKVYD